MKAIHFRIAYALGFIAASCTGGWYLGAFISRLPFWMPPWLFEAIHIAVKLSGQNKIDNEDDIETLGLICLLIASCAVIALALRIASNLVGQYVRRRLRSS
ncbi:hypothetical protein K788_00005300 [Paraburkholderia caribensis MBA4]|uniref:Transmembrane protein n=1 Tax=Paraburkholderia caribensis MBA4 TaxID=1323664 RepID=A0A0P0RH73_9BURK|nr:hypothetical protein [Paraburkholderia caribensis]ALL67903.1 hypothetical protein K788_00005300 [Paraburkholderia caribensis MBA4]